jgi:hypothetical protein
MEESYLFNDTDWFTIQSTRKEKLRQEIAALDSQRILNSSIDDLCDYFEASYQLMVPELDKSRIVADQREVDIDVTHEYGRRWSTPGPHFARGTEVSLTIPFSGEAGLFKIQPTSFNMTPPRGEVKGNQLILRVCGPKLDVQSVKLQTDQNIAQIETYLRNLKLDVDALSRTVRPETRQQLEARKAKLLADRNLVSELGYALRERADTPRTYAPPEVRRRLKPELPPQSTTPFKPEPALTSDDYEHILNVLGHMARVMELSPSAFRAMDEESLRSHFLVQLNGHYEGNATGETFNYSGKTDILLRVDGRNIFIGECKYWGGAKMLTDTLDQLLSYSSWRDTKVAMIIFNRNKNFSAVLETIVPTIQQHPNFKRLLQISGETRFRFVISHRDDPAREMIVTVLAFDVPSI